MDFKSILAIVMQATTIAAMIPDVIKKTRDAGFQSVVNNVGFEVEQLVASGHLPKTILAGVDDVIESLVTHSPLVKLPAPAAPPAPAAVAAAAPTTEDVAKAIDLDDLATRIAAKLR